MSIDSERDLRGLLAIGRIVGETLQVMIRALEPGMTTRDLDYIGETYLKKHGAQSAPRLAYNFPGGTCISINEEIAHGIPGDRIIQPGDLVNIDVSAEMGGYIADTGASIPVPPVPPEIDKLCSHTRRALDRAISAAQEGNRINAVGRVVQDEAQKGGFNIIRELSGHGVGRKIHEKPSVPNYFTNRAKDKLTDGLVITLEPFLTFGAGKIFTDDDGWTIKTADGKRSAQYEHTIIINGDKPILVTAV